MTTELEEVVARALVVEFYAKFADTGSPDYLRFIEALTAKPWVRAQAKAAIAAYEKAKETGE